MTEIECPHFTEEVACEMDGEYKIAHGWTQSTGMDGDFPYTLPAGWMFDSRYSDIRGNNGSHGGCPHCWMVLVHLISIDPVMTDQDPTPNIPEPMRSFPIVILVAAGSYAIYKLMEGRW